MRHGCGCDCPCTPPFQAVTQHCCALGAEHGALVRGMHCPYCDCGFRIFPLGIGAHMYAVPGAAAAGKSGCISAMHSRNTTSCPRTRAAMHAVVLRRTGWSCCFRAAAHSSVIVEYVVVHGGGVDHAIIGVTLAACSMGWRTHHCGSQCTTPGVKGRRAPRCCCTSQCGCSAMRTCTPCQECAFQPVV